MTLSRLHRIAVLNRSTVVADSMVQAITHALQHQVTAHFSPVWGIGAHVDFVPKDDLISWKGKWQLVVLDTSDEAGALGYHDLSPEGLPLGKVFAKTDKLYGVELSVTLSHELLEMLGDPNINLCAQANNGDIYAYENCDAVEADGLGYRTEGVLVSDFVTPAWFSEDAPGPYSYKNNVTKPFWLAKGGYISVFVNGSWTQRYAMTAKKEGDLTHRWIQDVPEGSRAPVGSRRERRRTPRGEWRRSAE